MSCETPYNNKTMKKALILFGTLLLAASPLQAQAPDPLADIGGLEMSRPDLVRFLEYYNQVIASDAYSERTRARAKSGITLIQERLDMGDFKIGDRVVLAIQGEWDNVGDTFPVEAGPEITLPVMGTVSLRGVLRSELETHMTAELGRFIQNPVVQAESLIRIQILGQVSAPGFYTVQSTDLIGEAIMTAGGPTSQANIEKMKILRATEEIWEGEVLQEAMADGLTLDQMSLRAGDQIDVPQVSQRAWTGELVRIGLMVAVAGIFGTRIF